MKLVARDSFKNYCLRACGFESHQGHKRIGGGIVDTGLNVVCIVYAVCPK